MKDYVLYELNEKMYGVFLLCLSHENIFSFCEEVEQELFIQNSSGYILLDQLLVTGNRDNRFVAIPYDYGKIDFSKAHNTIVDRKIRELSVELLNRYATSLQNTILTDDQQEMIRKRIAIG